MGLTGNQTKKRLLFVFTVICFVSVGLMIRVGWVQLMAAQKYSGMAVEQQTRDIPIPAKRGKILDSTGKELAVSEATNTIWARPGNIKDPEAAAASLSAILSQGGGGDQAGAGADEQKQPDQNKILELLKKKVSIVCIAKNVGKEQAEQIRTAAFPGISIAEDVRRYYPLGPFAAHVIGSTNKDNRGLSGIELKYDKVLNGEPGRWIKNTDRDGESLENGVEEYYEAKDGLNITLTIDEVIQHYVEKALDQVETATQASRVMCLVMDPKTGDVLAMAMTPDFDPNDPRTPMSAEGAAYVESLSDTQKLDFWNAMWRNPMISDTYEPGSTFKLITTSIALETGATKLTDKFNCTGYYDVSGTKLKCWRYYRPHGSEDLTQAVGNSCNPVFIQLGQRIGEDKYFEYLKAFGITEKTGIDFPGEGKSIIQSKEAVGPVELATMSFGQGIAVTPIELLTAVCAIGNDGKLMQPRLVKQITDEDGNVVERFDPKVVRQVISEKTAADMRGIMEYVVREGGGNIAQVPGYRIGGKTGTAQKPVNGRYGDAVYGSFVAMAPMDDPKVAILFIVDEPKGVHFGSQTAGPGIKTILEETFRYYGIKPSYTPEEQEVQKAALVEVPDVTGKNFSVAYKQIAELGLNYTVSPVLTDNQDFIIVDQFPKAGAKLGKGTYMCLYK